MLTVSAEAGAHMAGHYLQISYAGFLGDKKVAWAFLSQDANPSHLLFLEPKVIAGEKTQRKDKSG